MVAAPFDSRDFDAVHALAEPNVVPPVPGAQPKDHILQCRVYLPASHPLAISPVGIHASQISQRSDLSAKRKPADRTKDRGHGQARSGPKVDIIDSMMEGLASKGGPMAWLSNIVRLNTPVRVVTRHRRGGQRGIAVGRIVAFDKHMNLVLQDVTETYTVRKMVYKERIDAMRPVLESRTRSIANCLLTGRSIVSVQSAPNVGSHGSAE